VVDRVVAAGDAQLQRTLEVARARAQEAEEKSRAEAAIRIQAAARRRCVLGLRVFVFVHGACAGRVI
jgi:hypothetical protein